MSQDIRRPHRAREPQEDHRRDYRNPCKEEQRRAQGEPPSSHSAEAPGSCSDKPTGPASSRLRRSRSSHGPRDPRPWGKSSPKQGPNIALGAQDPLQAPPPHPALHHIALCDAHKRNRADTTEHHTHNGPLTPHPARSLRPAARTVWPTARCSHKHLTLLPLQRK
ncbi:hypothetical protein AMECASPLE_012756 [Ameca splendens]|uniref:Uncharacterized protein n=1 Tax=Ameca splendens TaxID=208324 RepID=A0ABV0YC71_9TELE